MKLTNSSVLAAYVLVGLSIVCISVLAFARVPAPEVLPTVLLVLVGGGVGATLPRDTAAAPAQVLEPAPAPAPAPVAAPVATHAP